jgi:hypothetical protein
MKQKRLLSVAVFAIALSSCQDPQTAQEVSLPADLLMINGYVYTADADRSVAEAVAVREGEIIYVGTTDEAMGFRGADTPIIDLNGRMMLPGLHDTHLPPGHCHLRRWCLSFGTAWIVISLRQANGCRSMRGISHWTAISQVNVFPTCVPPSMPCPPITQ